MTKRFIQLSKNLWVRKSTIHLVEMVNEKQIHKIIVHYMDEEKIWRFDDKEAAQKAFDAIISECGIKTDNEP